MITYTYLCISAVIYDNRLNDVFTVYVNIFNYLHQNNKNHFKSYRYFKCKHSISSNFKIQPLLKNVCGFTLNFYF